MPVRPRLGLVQGTAFQNKGITFLSEWTRKQYSAIWDHNALDRTIEKKQWTGRTSSRDGFARVLSREL